MMLNPKQEWLRLSSLYTSDSVLQHQLWQELEQLYSSPGRHYHTLEHITNLLYLFSQHKSLIQHPDLFEFAVYYHDAVYKPDRQDNEEQSARLAHDRLQQLGLQKSETDQVAKLILATKQHLPQDHPDASLLLDFDLSILGADQGRYLQYALQIRKEYRVVPDSAYRSGRIKVLQNFLSRRYLYQTGLMRHLFERQARANLQHEVMLLQQA